MWNEREIMTQEGNSADSVQAHPSWAAQRDIFDGGSRQTLIKCKSEEYVKLSSCCRDLDDFSSAKHLFGIVTHEFLPSPFISEHLNRDVTFHGSAKETLISAENYLKFLGHIFPTL